MKLFKKEEEKKHEGRPTNKEVKKMKTKILSKITLKRIIIFNKSVNRLFD